MALYKKDLGKYKDLDEDEILNNLSAEELKQLDEKLQRRVEKLEHQCHREAKEFAHKVGRPAQLSCKTAYSFRPCYKITQFKGRRNDDTFMEEDEKQISDLQSELIRS
jgi:hypothetical protein